eukprot:g11349.t1
MTAGDGKTSLDVVERHFPAALELRRTAGLSAALWRELHEKLTLAVAVDLDCEDGRKLRVATSHLYWDPRFPDLKLLQAFLLDQELSDFTGGLILAGDLNSTPLLDGRSSGEGVLSGVYQLLTQGDVEVLHPHHPVQMRPKDVPEFRISPYRSAAVEARGAEAATNASADFAWPRIEAQVPEIADLHLEPSLFPAILGFFTYTVGKVLAGLLK